MNNAQHRGDDLRGRVALVTGGSRGIGRACCLRLARAGASVAVNFARQDVAAADVVDAIRSEGGTAAAFQADVTSENAVKTMVADVERALGPIDLLVNNAGIFERASHTETTPELWRRTIDTNLTGVYTVTWAVKDGMVARRFGSIVNLTSVSALRARPMSIAYAASKAGVVALTKSLAEAVAGDGVRVNAVAPGLIDTEILEGVDQGVLDGLVETTPMKRIGTPEEIADVVHFLLSDASRFMTGQTLVASGGRVMLP